MRTLASILWEMHWGEKYSLFYFLSKLFSELFRIRFLLTASLIKETKIRVISILMIVQAAHNSSDPRKSQIIFPLCVSLHVRFSPCILSSLIFSLYAFFSLSSLSSLSYLMHKLLNYCDVNLRAA